MDEKIARFKGEEERVVTGEILRPCRETIACDEKRFFELAVELCGEFGVDELGDEIGSAKTVHVLSFTEDFIPADSKGVKELE